MKSLSPISFDTETLPAEKAQILFLVYGQILIWRGHFYYDHNVLSTTVDNRVKERHSLASVVISPPPPPVRKWH